MQLGMIGLGRMGSNMVKRLLEAKQECVVYARHPEPVDALVKVGAKGSTSLEDMVKKLDKPRSIWLMMQAAQAGCRRSRWRPGSGGVVSRSGSGFPDNDHGTFAPKGIHYLDWAPAGASGALTAATA